MMTHRMSVNVCELCGLEFSVEASCLAGKGRIPYGSEQPPTFSVEVCHDCNVALGSFHHLGCDAEECPRCRGAAVELWVRSSVVSSLGVAPL